MSNNYTTIPAMFKDVVLNNPEKNIFNYKKDNQWFSLSGKEVFNIVESISSALRYYNLSNNDKIAILSTTSYKWALCDYGILCNGSVTVTVYPTLIDKQIAYIINNSETKLIFVEDQQQLTKINNIKSDCPNLEKIVLMDNSASDNSDEINFDSFIDIGLSNKDSETFNFDKIIDAVKPDD